MNKCLLIQFGYQRQIEEMVLPESSLVNQWVYLGYLISSSKAVASMKCPAWVTRSQNPHGIFGASCRTHGELLPAGLTDSSSRKCLLRIDLWGGLHNGEVYQLPEPYKPLFSPSGINIWIKKKVTQCYMSSSQAFNKILKFSNFW